MNPIDRFTRDEASARVWWPYALLIIIAIVLTFPGRNRAVEQVRTDAAGAAAAWAERIAADPEVVRALADLAVVDAVRVWAADGSLVSSTDEADDLGSQAALNDMFLQAAEADAGEPISESSEATITGEPGGPQLRVYTATAAETGPVVIEIALDEELLLDATRDWWLNLQVVLAVAGLVVLGLALLSMRTPVAPIGAGVPFYEASVPYGAVVLSADEATELRQASSYARRRIGEQRERVDELENEKLRLEGELQRVLSSRSLAPGARPAIPRPGQAAGEPVAPRQPEAMPAPAPVPEVPVLKIPDPEPDVSPQPEPEPVAEVIEVPEAVESGTEVSAEAEPAPEPEPEPEPAPEPAQPASADDSMGFVLVPETEMVKQPEPPAPPVVRVPEVDDERHDAEVLDVLERLVEPVGGGPTADPSEMRARLARTAARKKPGSRADERFHE